MKFLCDRCKTRYSIGDDRVRGKILKIRCKNCANVITVREGMAEAEAEPVAAATGAPRRTAKPTTLAPPAQVSAPTTGAKPPAALEEEWYVSIDGEQSGPFSLHEAQRWIGAKPVAADLHCWSEGFDDWLPVDKVSHFRGLRKKPATPTPAPAPPPRAVAPPPPPPQQPVEDEPKPLFAATMAAIEKSAAAAAPPSARATPIGGIPSLPTPRPVSNGSAPHAALPRPVAGPSTTPAPQALRQSGSVPAIPSVTRQTGGVPAIPGVRGGTGPRPALPLEPPRTPTGPRPALPFDASDDNNASTQIEVPPFGDDARTAAEPAALRARALPGPFGGQAALSTATPPPAPYMTPPPAFAPPPAAAPSSGTSPSGTGANGAMGMASPSSSPWAMPLAAPPPAMPEPEPEPEGDIEIGEVSRVVNLADLARNHAATKAAAARKTGASPRLRTTGMNPSLNGGDPIAAMVATPDAGYTNGAMVPEPAAAPQSHKKLYLLLGVVVLFLLGGVGAMVYAVSQNGDDESTAISQGREVDLTRPDDPLHHRDPKPDIKDPTPHVNPNQHRPYVPPVGSGKVPVSDPDTGDTNALKAEEIEAMARTQSEATNRCYMRSQRGADAILIGDVKKINVTITVDKEGAVSGVDLSDHATDSLGKCLQSRIKGWRFHPSGKGLTTRLTLVFQAS